MSMIESVAGSAQPVGRASRDVEREQFGAFRSKAKPPAG